MNSGMGSKAASSGRLGVHGSLVEMERLWPSIKVAGREELQCVWSTIQCVVVFGITWT